MKFNKWGALAVAAFWAVIITALWNPLIFFVGVIVVIAISISIAIYLGVSEP